MAKGRGGVVKRFQYSFLFPVARSGLNSAPVQDSRRRLCSRNRITRIPSSFEKSRRYTDLFRVVHEISSLQGWVFQGSEQGLCGS